MNELEHHPHPPSPSIASRRPFRDHGRCPQRRSGALIIVVVACLAGVRAAGAQQIAPREFPDPLEARRVPAARPPLVTRRDLVVGATAIAVTAAVSHFDRRSAAFLQAPRLQRMSDLQSAARDAAFMGGPGPFLLGGVLFAGGRLTSSDAVADVGIHLTEALVMAATINGVAKGVSGRALPQASADPDNIELGRGFHRGNGPYVSFPSGHTAAAFAMAAVLSGETGRLHPQLSRFVTPLAYGGASVIGLARMYQNVHWASDLPIAALIGTWSGMAVVSHQHEHPRNWIDRWLLNTSAAPAGHGGVMLTWSMPAIGGAASVPPNGHWAAR